MLRNTHIKSLFNLQKALGFKNVNQFVKQKQIDTISQGYGSGNWQKIKMYGTIFRSICIEGFKGAKSDLMLFSKLKAKDDLTEEQTKQVQRINNDVYKMGPLLIIQILPFSGPLFMLYMYTYPGSIPSWFMIDYYHDRHEQLKVRNQTKNMQFFKQKGLKAQDINLDSMSTRQLRKLALLLFGIYRDGTIGYRKLFNKKIQYFLSEGLSRYLIRRNLQKRFKRDLILNKFTNQMSSVQEMVKWKYDRIMKGQFKLQYSPMYQDTVQKMKTNEGQQTLIFKQIQREDQVASQLQRQKQENKAKENTQNYDRTKK